MSWPVFGIVIAGLLMLNGLLVYFFRSRRLGVSEQTIRKLIDTLPTGVYICDVAGIIESCNRRAVELWGREPRVGDSAELFCGSFRMYTVDGAYLPHAESPMAEVLQTGIAITDRELVIERPDGLRRSIIVNVVPRRDAQGKLTGAINCLTDITERKSAEDALRKSERILREAEELGHTGSWERNLVTDEVFNSDENRRLYFGDDLDRGERFEDYVAAMHPDDRRMLTERRSRLLAEGDSHDIEFRVVWPDGSVHQLYGRASGVRDESGKLIRVYGTNVDITERKRAEDALRAGEAAFREAQRVAKLGSWEWHAGSDITNWSDELYRIFGLDPALPAPTLAEHPSVYVPASWAVLKAAVDEAMRSGAPYEFDLEINRPDGTRGWIAVLGEVIRDSAGLIVGLRGTAQDITERKRVEGALRENQQLLNLVLATLPVGVVVLDSAGNIVLANAASKRIWGADMIVPARERWERSKGFWHVSGKALAPEEWASARALSKGLTSLNELIDIESYDGLHKTMQNSSVPIRNAEGKIVGAVVVNEDVTLRIHAEEALLESTKRLQQLSRRLLLIQEEERRHLALELHDEFGQLLTAVSLHLEGARRAAGEGAQTNFEKCADLLKRAGEQMRGLAFELRPMMLETAGLDATLRWFAEQHQRRTGMVTEVVGHTGGVSGDPAIASFRVVQEALTNVARHARAQHVSIELSRSKSALSLTIADDGTGFDVAATLGRASDYGHLGLLGMKERVQILGGTLKVDSELGRGTRISVSLPMSMSVTEPAQ